MSIKETQVLDRSTLNRAFVSKSATGTQIMAGSLRLLGGITVDGTTTLGAITTGAISAGANAITTTGTITAGTFSGSAASLTNIPAGNLAGTVADARLSTNVVLLNKAQTFTANNTYSTAANLYFAGGTTYYINTAGSANFNALTASGVVTFNGASYLTFGSAGSAPPSDTSAGVKIKFWGNSYQFGIESNSIWYDTNLNHNFYTNGGNSTRTLRAAITATGLNVEDDLVVKKNLEVQGEFNAGGTNEFPDPLVESKSTAHWGTAQGGTFSYDIQKPAGTGATGSIKMVTTDTTRSYLYSVADFEATPSEWINFSAYAFSTTSSKKGRMCIRWKNAAGTEVARVDVFQDLTTEWKRYSMSAQAPATATKFDVSITSEGASTTVYWSGFQVERGRTTTPLKPFLNGVGLYGNNLKLRSQGEIHSSYNDNYIIKDHANGNVTLSAAGGNLFLGYQNTSRLILQSSLYAMNNSLPIIGTDGTLYHKGTDLDSLYFKSAGGTVSGATTFSGNTVVNGNLGVKQSAPAYPLDVTGSMRLTGSFYSDTITNFLTTAGGAQGAKMGSLTLSSSYSDSAPASGLFVKGNTGLGIAPAHKLHVAGDTRTTTTLYVGTGTQANDLTVTSGGALNWRNTLYSGTAGKVSINKATNSEHPLDVKSNGSYQGINIQNTATTDISGVSFQNADGKYSWHLASGNTANSDMVLFSGLNATLSALPEVTKFYAAGGLWTSGNITTPQRLSVGAGSGLNQAPAISLSIGDGDTGFNWVSDGQFNIMANSGIVANITSTKVTVKQPLATDSTLTVGSTATASKYYVTSGDGDGVHFWNSTTYSIYMSTSTNGTHGGTLPWTSGDDYNMYFKMGSNNRGFAFSNPTQGGVNAQIEGNGRVNSKVGFRANKFEMAFNETENSLDFIFYG